MKEVEKPTVEIDWDTLKNFPSMFQTCFNPDVYGNARVFQLCDNQRKYNVEWMRNKVPGHSIQDNAIAHASNYLWKGSIIPWTGPKWDTDPLHQVYYTPKEFGVPRYEGTPEQNARLIRVAARVFGSPDVGFVKLSEKTKKLLWACIRFENVEEGYDPGDGTKVLPDKDLWVICSAAGAGKVVGIDPSLRCLAQHLAVARLLRGVSGGSQPFHFLPLALEDLPAGPAGFDTVLSMGVIYHRRDPAAHLARLRDLLRLGGQLVLEGLVVEDPATPLLVPGERYAKMRNVRSIPSPQRLVRWVEGAGFRDARVVDVTPTTVVEQRRTAWMRFESLAYFLDAADPSRTKVKRRG